MTGIELSNCGRPRHILSFDIHDFACPNEYAACSQGQTVLNTFRQTSSDFHLSIWKIIIISG